MESETFQGGQSISRVANYISYPHLKKKKDICYYFVSINVMYI